MDEDELQDDAGLSVADDLESATTAIPLENYRPAPVLVHIFQK
jgi:hypothetical protein